MSNQLNSNQLVKANPNVIVATVQTFPKEEPKKTTKNASKKTNEAEKLKALEAEIKKLNEERFDFIADMTALTEAQEELKKETEKTEIENAILKASLKAAEEQKVKEEENEKQIELLKKQLSETQKPTHSTAAEKLERLQKANQISNMLERRKELFESFISATTGDEKDQFKIIFQCSNGATFDLAKSEIVKKVTDITYSYMQQTIEETEKELLSYQI